MHFVFKEKTPRKAHKFNMSTRGLLRPKASATPFLCEICGGGRRQGAVEACNTGLSRVNLNSGSYSENQTTQKGKVRNILSTDQCVVGYNWNILLAGDFNFKILFTAS